MLYEQNEPRYHTKQSTDEATCQADNSQKIAAAMLGLLSSLTDSGIHVSLGEIETIINFSF